MNLKWINYNVNPALINTVWEIIKLHPAVKAMRKISDELVEVLVDTIDDVPLPETILTPDHQILISRNWAK
jgi:hypothetical protein